MPNALFCLCRRTGLAVATLVTVHAFAAVSATNGVPAVSPFPTAELSAQAAVLSPPDCDACDVSGGYPSCCLGCGSGPGEDTGTGCTTPQKNQFCHFASGPCEETTTTLLSGEVVHIAMGACSDTGLIPVQSDSSPTLRERARLLLSATARDGTGIGFLVLSGTNATGWPHPRARRSGWRSSHRR